MVDRVASVTTYVGAGAATIGGLALNDWMLIGGFIVAVAGFVVNCIFKYRLLQIASKKGVVVNKEE